MAGRLIGCHLRLPTVSITAVWMSWYGGGDFALARPMRVGKQHLATLHHSAGHSDMEFIQIFTQEITRTYFLAVEGLALRVCVFSGRGGCSLREGFRCTTGVAMNWKLPECAGCAAL